MIQLKLNNKVVYPIENAIRTLSKKPCYLAWALFDCDRKERDEAIYANISDGEWSDDQDARQDEINEEQKDFGNRTILTYAARVGECKPDLYSPFAFRIG